MTTYALIDNFSGYVWGVYLAASPEAACAAATLESGGDVATYGPVFQLASNADGYFVRAAWDGFSVSDGQNQAEIEAVEALPLVGQFRREAVALDEEC